VRAVIDTNVLLSGLLWRGPPHAVMEHVRAGAITFVTTVALLEEFAEVIRRPKFQAILARVGVSENQILSELSRLAEIIDPPPLPEAVCRDPDDDAVLAAAAAGQAELIISGDADCWSSAPTPISLSSMPQQWLFGLLNSQ
jgi:putative PIN family toxin of toxin-antitoxin system